MKRNKMKIGTKVRVVPKHTYNEDGSIKHHPERIMWVRELHNKMCAGLSHRWNSKSVYGILYEVIEPLSPKTVL